MSQRPTASEDRLFVREPLRHYRRTYSHAEVRWGLLVFVILAAVGVWIGWKGSNPDPTLFASSDPTATMELPGETQAGEASRGPLPEDLAPEGWTETQVASFDPSTLYVKINGRADYFLSFGFKNLHFVTLEAGDDDEAPVIDIECYDLGTSDNALGAFAGEKKDGEPETRSGGLAFLSSNALFLARDRYYIRAIGSDGSDAIKAGLTAIRDALESAIEGGERPWAHELFNGKLGIAIDAIRYSKENAFSFEFAGDFYSALADGDVQLFVSARASADEASELASKLRDGFATLGARQGDWIKDKYIGTMTTATAEGTFVIGVRNAPDKAAGASELERLRAALDGISTPAAVNDPVGEPVYDEPGAPDE